MSATLARRSLLALIRSPPLHGQHLTSLLVPTQAPRVAARCHSTEASPPQVGRLNHVAVAVPDLAEAAERYQKVLGAAVSEPQHLPEHGVSVVFVRLPNATIELLHPLGEASPIANFLKKNPAGGVHHICLETPDIEGTVQHVSSLARVLDPKPKIGAHGHPVVFMHPKDMAGVLIELEEVKS